ncbi:OmpA family protein [Puniceibacterium confluentis]|uniref:OmpA family protein n=1 Tax=Puniceibacterium confluentis TaxID=1958944 RepID=UPI001FE82248|nr:OmpA family protein [Puniceibacterium confluentis]
MKIFTKSALLASALVTGLALPAAAQNLQCGVVIFFPSGQNALGPSASAAVQAFASANPGASFTVTGYTDAPGSAAANAALSQRRAQSVAAAMTATNVSSVVGGGEATRPGTTGPNDPANRRVEVVNDACAGGLYQTTTVTRTGPFDGTGLAVAAGVGALALGVAFIDNDSSGGTTN